MNRCFIAFAALLAGLSGATPTGVAQPLPTDSRVQSGTLENGLEWMFCPHDNPPGKLALALFVRAGSLNEADAQQGLAHFIEHMVRAGSENFPPGEIGRYFESLGMQMGRDVTGSTSFDKTYYSITIPDVTPERIEKALMALSDFAFRALFPEEEIEKQRGIILEETRTGKSTYQRLRDKLWPDLFEGSQLARRMPIGKEEVVAVVPRSEFLDFYRTWYRPENMTVMVAGDVEAPAVMPLIRKWFGEYRAEGAPRAQVRPGLKPFTAQRAFVVTDPEMALAWVEVVDIRPHRPRAVTTEQWREELIERIGTWVINRRHKDSVSTGQASYRGAATSVFDFFHDALLVYSYATGEPDDWAGMLDGLLLELKRAQEYGFTQHELDLAKKEILSEARRAVQTEPTQSASKIIKKMTNLACCKMPILSAQQELDLCADLLPSIQLSEVSETFRDRFSPGAFAYLVILPEKEDVALPSESEVLARVRAAWMRRVEPPSEEVHLGDLLVSLPEPGEVAEIAADEDLGITGAWLDNGVRVHHRFMDYKKDSVWVSVSLAGGRIEETEKNRGVTRAALLAINQAATGRLSSGNMRDIMTGRNISVWAGDEGDSVTIDVSGSPVDLETGLQKVHALLVDGKIEASAFENWKLSTLEKIAFAQTCPKMTAFRVKDEVISGSDPRWASLTSENVAALSLEQAQAWFDRLRKESPIEVAVVGDIELQEAMLLAQRYIGSLPPRRRAAEHLINLRRLNRADGPILRRESLETITPMSMIITGFAGCEANDYADVRALELAARVLNNRVVRRVRNEQSLVYSIYVDNNPVWAFENGGCFGAVAPCSPGNAGQVAAEVQSVFQDFRDNGPSDEELEIAKRHIANVLDEKMREPKYWLKILRHLDLRRFDLQEAKIEKEAYELLTAQQVQQVFRKYYTPERQFQVISVPVARKTTAAE
ncbi:MAG: insulinase family protein [Phycisphaerales bacterium]|nr:MAG: insulinase family protein [Phycisphaerales bacterium]